MVRLVARVASGPRTKWAVLGAWLVLVAVFGALGSKLPEVTTDDTAGALPADTQSGEVSRLLEARFPDGETQPALIVFRRRSGLAAADRAAIDADAARAARAPLAGRPLVPF